MTSQRRMLEAAARRPRSRDDLAERLRDGRFLRPAVFAACPPVVEYSRAEQTLIAEEVVALPEDAQIVGWLADYAALREQVKACVRT